MAYVKRVAACGAYAAALVASAPFACRGVLEAQMNAALPDVRDLVTETGSPLCNGEIVREIVIYSSAPSVAGVRKLPVIGELARSAHITTQPDVIRRFLLLKEEDRCTELARAESERVLRAQPFIADATIAVVRVADGLRLEVRSIDEASFVFGTRMGGGAPFVRRVRFGNANVAGTGVYLSGEWRDGGAVRNGYGVTATDHQFGGKPFVLHLQARQAPLGGEWTANLIRPFLTSLQRHAWRVGGGEAATYTHLEHPDAETRAIRIEREYADGGFMGRIGPPAKMALVGLALSHEREAADSGMITFTPHGAPMPAGAFRAPAPYVSSRVNGFVGVRALSFVRAEGFDGLTATQDIPVGYQAGLVVGRGLNAPERGGRSRELFVAADIYGGRGDEGKSTRVQLRAQGSRSPETTEWERVVSTGRVTHQQRLSTVRLLEVTAEWAGAWRPGIPMQLLLGAEEGGVRGYDHARTGGARRATLHVEQRQVIGRINGTMGDVGLATFADVGRVWRGDAPLGVTTPMRASLGVSLLAAVPARSGRLWRFDVAMPLQGNRAGRVEFAFSNADRTSVFWREPRDIGTMRNRTVPASVFAWP